MSAQKRSNVDACRALAERLQSHARIAWPQCGEVSLRCRSAFIYVSVCPSPGDEPEPLCRLRRAGSGELWEFSRYSFASDKYEASLLPSGSAYGKLEDCFDCAAITHLQAEPDAPISFEEFLRRKRKGGSA